MIHTNKDKHLSAEQVAICADALNDGTYSQLHEDLRHHLHMCHTCADEVLNVAEIVSDTGEINIPFELNKDIEDKKHRSPIPVNRYIISITAAAAIIFAVIIFNNQWLSLHDNHDIAVIQNKTFEEQNKYTTIDDSVNFERKAEKNHEVIIDPPTDYESGYESINDSKLALFEPDPILEQLYHNMQGTYRGRTIEIKTPPKTNYFDGLKLQWKNPKEHTLHLELFNNNGEEIHAITTSKESIELPSLQPGLYYWKLISEDFDLLFVGKIIKN